MKINLGSKNQTKLSAVRDILALYPKLFPDPSIVSVDVQIAPFGHPKNLKEIIQGARERAEKSFTNCSYSIGLESGLMEVSPSKTGFMEISACVFYDGKNFYLGFSSAFAWPTEVTRLILSGNMDGSQAFKKLGLTEHEKLGAAEGGIINVLTNGRLTREEQIKQSMIAALIQLERPELY